jgi:mannosyl-oligosaccharide alpha-1,2-mannosidase
MGVTTVDSIDTLLLADLPQEYLDARQWTVDELKFGTPEQEDINLFETTIRVVGGLLGAFELSQDQQFVEMAADVATRMADIAFQDPFGIPYGTIGLKSGKAFNPSWVSGASAVSEIGTLQLEFSYLSHLTGDSSLEKKGRRVMRHLERLNVTDGLYPIYLSPTTGKFLAVPVTLGARGDSVYEYLLKQWLQLRPRGTAEGRASRDWLRSMYTRSVRGILDRLLMHSAATGMAFISEQVLPVDALKPDQSPKPLLKMDHLVCFAPGMLALGAMHRAGFAEGQRNTPRSGFFAGVSAWGGKDGAYARLINVSLALLRTCNTMYTSTTTGLAPEIVTFYPSGPEMRPNHDALHSLLRPETVESMFVLWRLTKQPWIREAAWDIFVAIERHARVWSGGHSSVDSANWGAASSVAKAKTSPTDSSKAANDADRPFSWAEQVVRSANQQERRRCRAKGAAVADARCAWVPDGGPSADEPGDAVFEPDESGPRDTRNMQDHMESFFLAETLKYLYLIFSEDSVLPLDEYVFNTEAHPFKMV